MNEMAKKHVISAFIILKFTYGIATVIAGLDKFFGVIADWVRYISPLVSRYTPIPTITLLYTVGAFQILIGLLILSRHTRIGSYLLAVFLFGLTFNYISFGMFFDIAARNFIMAMSALALACLSEAISALKESKSTTTPS